MKKSLLIIIFLFLLIQLVYSLSFFSSSAKGIGFREYYPHTRGMGMGGTGLAIKDSLSLNAYNFSDWISIKNTRITFNLKFSYIDMDLGFQEITTYTGNFNGLQIGIPIQKQKWVLGFSITPYSLVDFSFNQKYDTTNAIVKYEQNTFYKGDISRAQLNLSWAPMKSISIGASLNYFFGGIDDRFKLIFNNPNYPDKSYEIKYQFFGPGIGSSLSFNPTQKVRFGGFIDFKAKINFTRIHKSLLNFSEIRYETKSSIPLSWGAGLSWEFQPQWIVSGDYVFQNWSEGFGIEGASTVDLTDWYRGGIGIEHSLSRKNSKPFFNKFDLRAGFSYGTIGYQFNGNTVMEYGGHFGLGFPFFEGRARLDLAFIAGIRGDKDKVLTEENFYRFVISVSAGELWFKNIR
jgi:long-subunit fatty acid transport protein